MLYKSNGDDKYPGFKLYKMISKLVHKHLPENQYEHSVMTKFRIDTMSDEVKMINIDEMN